MVEGGSKGTTDIDARAGGTRISSTSRTATDPAVEAEHAIRVRTGEAASGRRRRSRSRSRSRSMNRGFSWSLSEARGACSKHEDQEDKRRDFCVHYFLWS